MHRQIPMANKICFQKNVERDMEIHRQKIKNIKCSIDKKSPKALQFLNDKHKKPTAQSLARNEEIERENNMLLRKITNIMQSGTGNSSGNAGGNKDLQIKKSQSFSTSRKVKSLNSEVRKRDLVKIVIENQAILKRIQNKKSAYNHKQWEEERKVTEKYINNKCEYQYKNYIPTHTQVRLGLQGNSNSQNSLGQSQMNSKRHLTGSNFRLKPIEHKQVTRKIFKTTRKIGLDYYYIDVKIQKGVFSIVLDNIEKSNQRYTIELLEKEGMTIWKKECYEKPELLLERVRVDERSKTVFFRRVNDQISVGRDDNLDQQNLQSQNDFYSPDQQQSIKELQTQENNREENSQTEQQQQQQQQQEIEQNGQGNSAQVNEAEEQDEQSQQKKLNEQQEESPVKQVQQQQEQEPIQNQKEQDQQEAPNQQKQEEENTTEKEKEKEKENLQQEEQQPQQQEQQEQGQSAQKEKEQQEQEQQQQQQQQQEEVVGQKQKEEEQGADEANVVAENQGNEEQKQPPAAPQPADNDKEKQEEVQDQQVEQGEQSGQETKEQQQQEQQQE